MIMGRAFCSFCFEGLVVWNKVHDCVHCNRCLREIEITSIK